MLQWSAGVQERNLSKSNKACSKKQQIQTFILQQTILTENRSDQTLPEGADTLSGLTAAEFTTILPWRTCGGGGYNWEQDPVCLNRTKESNFPNKQHVEAVEIGTGATLSFGRQEEIRFRKSQIRLKIHFSRAWPSPRHLICRPAAFQERMLMHSAPTRAVWVLSCVLSTGGRVSLTSYTCWQPRSSYLIQPNGVQNAPGGYV